MPNRWIPLLCALLCMLCAASAAEMTLPDEITADLNRQHVTPIHAQQLDNLWLVQDDVSYTLYILNPQGYLSSDCGKLLSDGNTLSLTRPDAGDPMTSPADYALLAHNAQTGVLDKAFYFRRDGSSMRLCGWFDRYWSDLLAIHDGETLSFWQLDGTLVERIPMKDDPMLVLRINPFLPSMYDLPHTVADGQRLAARTREAMAARYPGFTLLSYDRPEIWAAFAIYGRLSNGLLTLRFATNRYEEWTVRDMMPVPLSEAMLARLKTEPLNIVLESSAHAFLQSADNTFLVHDALDSRSFPVWGTIVQSMPHPNGLLLLAEEADGVRRVWSVIQSGEAYTARASQPLPEGASLSIFHMGDESINYKLHSEGTTISGQCMPDGALPITYVQKLEGGQYAVQPWGVRVDQRFAYGRNAWCDLLDCDLHTLPTSFDQAAEQLTHDNFAVVCNPNPADRLHLRESPRRNAPSLGKFYNGTPLIILGVSGDWAHVRIGDSALEGYMMKAYLAFGTAANVVQPAFPDLVLRDGTTAFPLYRTAALRKPATLHVPETCFTVVGLVEGEAYILLLPDGSTGYIPLDLLFEGNG